MPIKELSSDLTNMKPILRKTKYVSYFVQIKVKLRTHSGSAEASNIRWKHVTALKNTC